MVSATHLLVAATPALAGLRPEPGAWAYATAETKIGVLVDWSDWQGNMARGASARDLVQGLVSSGRCRSLYMYVLSDGHTVCPVEGSGLPSLGIAANLAALGEFTSWAKQQGVTCYGVIDLLEWHKAGSALPDPLSRDTTGMREKLYDGSDAPGSTYVSWLHPSVRRELERVVDAFSSSTAGLDGLVFDAHLAPDALLGGSAACAVAYRAETQADVTALVPSGASDEEATALRRFLAWRRKTVGVLVSDLARRAQKRPDLRVGLVGGCGAFAGGSSDRAYSLEDQWEAWARDAPHTVVLVTGDWTEPTLTDALRDAHLGLLQWGGCAACVRPVVTESQLTASVDLVAKAGPIDEVVIRIAPETHDKPVLEWAKGVPTQSPSRIAETLLGMVAAAPSAPVTLKLSGATPRAAIDELSRVVGAAAPGTGVALTQHFVRKLERMETPVTLELTDVPAREAIARLAAAIGACAMGRQDASAVTLWEANDPVRVLGDALRSAGRPDEAIELYDDAIARGADVPDALRAKGDIQLWTKWAFDPAIATYERLLAEGVRTPSLLASVGLCCAETQKVEKAAEYLLEALDTCAPDDAVTRSNANLFLGRVYHPTDITEAIVRYRAAIEARPTNEYAHGWLATGLLEMGDREGAKAEAEEALRLNPAVNEARRVLDQLKAEAGQ